jgi:Arc/MetJ family transcription regulator/predicted nucleic acid-binding protein
VTKTLVDLDDSLLATARDTLGTATKKETVNEALLEAVRLGAIQEFVQAVGAYERTAQGLVLADASALMHCGVPEVAARLLPLLVLDKVATCAAVKHELASLELGMARPALTALQRIRLRWLATDEADLARALDIQTELTQQGERALPWTRLVVAAVAGRHQATVLHYTSDYDLIVKVTGQDTAWVAGPRTLPSRSPQPEGP